MTNRILQALAPLVLTASAFAAEATFVSVTGSDANPCSDALPCRTFAAALAQTSGGGTVTALDNGDFTLGNTLFITGPPVTIDGGGHGASLSGPVNGPAILLSLGNYAPSGYTLRNLNITPGGGPGITGAIQGVSLVIERVNINMPNSQNALHAIDLQIDAFAKISLKDVNITMGTPHGGINQYGIVLMNPTQVPTTPYKAIFDRVTVHGGDVCATIQDGSATVSNSSFQDCVMGLNLGQLYATPVWLVDSTHLLNNTFGLNVGGGTLRLSNNVISGNTTGIVSYSSPTIVSFRNNVFAGNGTDNSPALGTSLK